MAFGPAARHVGEHGKNRQFIIVVPKNEGIVPEKNEAKCENDEPGERCAKEIVGRLCQTSANWDLVFAAFHRNALQHDRCPLGHHQDLFLNPVFARGFKQTLRRFMQRFEAQAKSSVMHRNQSFGTEFEKSFHGFFWIHVNFPACRRFVSTDGKQSNFDRVAVTDFSEAGEVGAIAAVKNGSAIRRNDEPAKVAVQICEKPGTPVMTGRERNFERTQLDCLPVIELVHDVKTEIVHQVSHAHWHNDRLVGCHAPQRAPVEMIEMSVSHQNEINRWQMMDFEPRLFQTLDYLEPLRPVRVNQDIDLVGLNKK